MNIIISYILHVSSSFSPSFDYTATIYVGQGSELIGSCFSSEFVFWGHSLIAGHSWPQELDFCNQVGLLFLLIW